jgi:hypothetical protein
MSEVRTLVDPTGVLPEIQLVPSETSSNGRGAQEIRLDGELVGRAAIRMNSVGEYFISSISVEPSRRREGIGTAAHIMAIEIAHIQGVAFRNDRLLTAGSAAIWQKFINAGIAEVIEPLIEQVHDFGATKGLSYQGYIRINPDLHT